MVKSTFKLTLEQRLLLMEIRDGRAQALLKIHAVAGISDDEVRILEGIVRERAFRDLLNLGLIKKSGIEISNVVEVEPDGNIPESEFHPVYLLTEEGKAALAE